MWEGLVSGQELKVKENGDSWIAEGAVRYQIMGRRVKHRRTVESTPESVKIEDVVDCSGKHEVEANLLFEGLLRWDSETRELLSENRLGICIEFSGWKQVSVKTGYISPVYGKKDPATRLVLSAPMRDRFEGTILCTGI